jgi:FAD/FMN-containing dehydrogenase
MVALLRALGRFVRTWSINTLNTAVYVLSLGQKTLHEGRYWPWRHRWSNWSRTFTSRPTRYVMPESEEEVCALVRQASHVRVVGAGHTFNACPLTDDLMLSLDRYNKLLAVDQERKTARVQTGVRLRDLTPQLQDHGLALPLLGSTNAQSIGGLIATDLHGTGRDHGFLSEQILALRIINAQGEAQTLGRDSEVFHAAIGGIGCCGIVTEVELQCVPAYNLEKSVWIVKRADAEQRIEELLQQHRHLSFYYLGGVNLENVRMNVWDDTDRQPPAWSRWREMYGELTDMLFSGYALPLARPLHTTRLTAWLGLKFFQWTMHGHKTVFTSAAGFSRKLYYHHDEMEYGVPFENYRNCLREILELLLKAKFTSIIEVRFTPDHSHALLGPGVGRRTCFIELAPSLSSDQWKVFAAAEPIFLKHGGQLHLGKATRLDKSHLRQMYGPRLERFEKVMREQDLAGKFRNEFARRMFE